MGQQGRPAWGHRMRRQVLASSTYIPLVEVEQVEQPFRDQRHYLAIRAIHHFLYDRALYQESKQA